MALTASIVITGIAIGLLVLYGADVIAGGGEAGEGFLPMDAKMRGIALGGPSVVLPIIGFFISRKKPSKTLGIMLIIAGILVLIGGIVSVIGVGEQTQETSRPMLAEGASLIAIGGFITALGAIKIKKS